MGTPDSTIEKPDAVVMVLDRNGLASQPSSPPIEKAPVAPSPAKPPYSAFRSNRRVMILGIVTAAGFLGPLSGGIYLPVLPDLERDFNVSSTVMNATVSVFMVVFAFAVS